MKKLIPLVLIFLVACNTAPNEKNTIAEDVPPDFYLGSWALTLDYDNNNVGWLEIWQQNDYLDASLLWRWGSVTPVEFVYYSGNKVKAMQGWSIQRKDAGTSEVVRTHHIQNIFKLEKEGEDRVTGMAIFPDASGIGVENVSFTGVKVPPVGEAPDLGSIEFGEPVRLFNGEDLNGWEIIGEGSVNGWKVTNGVLVNEPVQKEGEPHINYGNLRTTETFEDFNLSLEVNVPKGSNSGIYLRGIYEIQVMDSYGRKPDPHHMGALYSRIAPSVPAEKPAGEWQKLDITLADRHLTVVLNGITIINNQPVEGITGGAMTSDVFAPGPIYLQGDHGEVSYRNIILKPVVP